MASRDLDAAIAVTRFGLGAKPGELALAAGDPRGFLKAQVQAGGADIPPNNGENTSRRIADFRDYQRERQMARQQGRQPQDPVQAARRMITLDTATDFLGRFQLAAATDAGFRERWALFWANHFTVSAVKLATATVVGPFEAEAIRPHVFGRFSDLLIAASTHPAMLLYLDQAQSIGPDSPAAERRNRQVRVSGSEPAPRKAGLNENLAREILELHTVGVDGGYTQADVTEFARAMTGLGIGAQRDGESALGRPIFRQAAHEPGDRTIMGVRYPDRGQEQVEAILKDLAAKPQTARHLCTKLARHFVADDPPPALVARLETAWMRGGGRLDQVALALIDSPEAWAPEQRKFKTPYEFVASSWRAAGRTPTDVRLVAPVLNAMGQKAYSPPSPKGWPDEAAAWTAPSAVIQRLSWSQTFAAASAADDPNLAAAQALGALLRPATATAVRRAESRPEGLALLLMSPEFQRR